MEEPERKGWRLDRGIPAHWLIVHTIGFIWLAANQSYKLDNVIEIMKEYKAVQYTKEDARRDQDLNAARSQANSRRMDGIERRVEILESKR